MIKECSMENKPVILVVDDVKSNILMLNEILEDEYEIKTATSGQEALQKAKEEPLPDLILLDIGMPQMNGYEVFEELQYAVHTNIPPVVFVTGKDTEKDEEKGLLIGAVDYITKPLSPIIIKARVKTQIMLKHQRDELSYSASHDQLTKLYNRHYLAEEGARKFSRARRAGDKLSVLMIDIDHFKQVNDNYGHIVGDEILKSIANVLKLSKREEDFCARFGGEEFVVVLEGCNSKNAEIKANELREEIQNLNPSNIAITASFGVCEIDEKYNNFEDLLKDTDKALYEAKHSGRNKVITYA